MMTMSAPQVKERNTTAQNMAVKTDVCAISLLLRCYKSVFGKVCPSFCEVKPGL